MQLSLSLLKLSSILITTLEKYFSEFNLTLAKFIALIVLQREDREYLLISEIADNMGVSKKNTSRLLESLKKEKLISISPCSKDRRVKKVALLTKGKKILNLTLPGYYELLNHFFKDVTQTQKNKIATLLMQILK
ncbi:MAG: MarR family winged helix-turn-helix transcriptional regulator [Bdellovibrionales bacterium]